MTKDELVEKISKGADISKTDAGKALSAALDSIKATLKKGQKVTLVEHRLENRSGTVWIVISKKPTGGDATASISTSACNQSVQWKVYWQTLTSFLHGEDRPSVRGFGAMHG